MTPALILFIPLEEVSGGGNDPNLLDGLVIAMLEREIGPGIADRIERIKIAGVPPREEPRPPQDMPGEKLGDLDTFHPDRMASRILGMGDVLSLIEDVQKGIDEQEAAAMAKKLKSGKGFDLEDFKSQIQQMRKMGGMASLMEKMPGQIGQMAKGVDGAVADKAVTRLEGIINSMTPAERRKPELLKASRKRRIAAGAGVTVQEVNRLLKQFEDMQKMMKQFSKGGMSKLMRGMKGMLPGM